MNRPYLQGINESPSRVLAQTFSNPFTVFSAKKFPGMIGRSFHSKKKNASTIHRYVMLIVILLPPSESTPLSRAFARQGVKIPIRKDVAKGKKGEPAEEDDDE